MSLSPFSPGSATVNIDVAATAPGSGLSVANCPGTQQVRVMNNGSATAWIKFGTDTTVAATLAAGIPIGSGGTEVFTVQGPVFVSAIAAASTGKIYFTPGAGI